MVYPRLVTARITALQRHDIAPQYKALPDGLITTHLFKWIHTWSITSFAARGSWYKLELQQTLFINCVEDPHHDLGSETNRTLNATRVLLKCTDYSPEKCSGKWFFLPPIGINQLNSVHSRILNWELRFKADAKQNIRQATVGFGQLWFSRPLKTCSNFARCGLINFWRRQKCCAFLSINQLWQLPCAFRNVAHDSRTSKSVTFECACL